MSANDLTKYVDLSSLAEYDRLIKQWTKDNSGQAPIAGYFRDGDFYKESTGTEKYPRSKRALYINLAVTTKDLYRCIDETSTATTAYEMISVGGGDGKVKDVQVNGTSVLDEETGIANIPVADEADISIKMDTTKPITSSQVNNVIYYGLGSYTGTAFSDSRKTSARSTIGAAAVVEVEIDL